MPLSNGMRLGPYEVLAPFGAGGMGEVYEARDTRLDRTVAIKVLPSQFSKHPERRERFEREARAVSALNHPHICTLYDIGKQDDVEFLVMEYVDGENLADRLARGPLPIHDALRYAIEIVDALDKAHRQGITHRDLKPGNVMITRDGAKLLDFGLAKLRGLENNPMTVSASAIPTDPHQLTAQGAIIGTLQYMAPEQLEGKEADARTDIFAFGVTLYEMITGKKAFQGKTQVSLMAAILEHDPPSMSSLAPMTPATMERVVRKCLAKDPEDRWHNAHDLRDELKWVAEAATTAVPSAPIAASSKKLALAGWFAAALIAVVALPAVFVFRDTDVGSQSVRFTLQPKRVFSPPSITEVALSPDGKYLAFVDANDAGARSLWLRPLDGESRLLAGTFGVRNPFWSPDSRSIGFSAAGKLKKISIDGGARENLCDAPEGSAGSWSGKGIIIFSGPTGALFQVADTGGKAETLTTLDTKASEVRHAFPVFLPDGNHLLYLSMASVRNTLHLAALDSLQPKQLFVSAGRVTYSPGYLMTVREAKLMAYPFDVNKQTVTGDPVGVLDGVGTAGVNASFAASMTEVLAFAGNPGALGSQLTWYDRSGKTETLGDPEPNIQVRLSPDEKWALLHRGPLGGSLSDIWLLNLATKVFSRFTVNEVGDSDPIWSPDGRRIAFNSNRKGVNDFFEKEFGGNQEMLIWESGDQKFLEDWTKDGLGLIFRAGPSSGASKVFLLPLQGERKPRLLLDTPGNKDEMSLSPDGKWIAYNSNESGRHEVYVSSFPEFTKTVQVSNEGGGGARWRKDGKELFYMTLEGALMSVDIRRGATVETSTPKLLFQTKDVNNATLDVYAPTGDGKRFLVLEPLGNQTAPPITVLTNWTSLLKR